MKRGKCSKESIFYNPDFWLEAWQEHRDNSLRSRRIMMPEEVEFWNSSADKMKRWSEEDRSVERVKNVIRWLKQQGIVISDMRILDIGAGTGSFAIPFTQQGGRVTALEPVEELVKIMNENMKREGVEELSVIIKKWEDISPEKEGMEGQFDLVFASLTPAVYDKETLGKMNACSKEWCFLCEFAGRRRNRVQEELWFNIFKEDMPLPEYNIFYPLNYLYSQGYSPSLKLWREYWREEIPEDEAAANLIHFFSLYTEMTSGIKTKIADYLSKKANKGFLSEEYQSLVGMIVWNVNEKWDSN